MQDIYNINTGGQGMWLPVCRGRSGEEMGAAPGSKGFISNLRYRVLHKKSIGHSDLIRIFSPANVEMQDIYNINTHRLSGHLCVSSDRHTVVESLQRVTAGTKAWHRFYIFYHGAVAPQWARTSELSRIHDRTQTHHSPLDSSRRVISPTQRNRPYNTKHS